MYTAESFWANVPLNWPREIDNSISDFESQYWFPLHGFEDDRVLYHYTDSVGLKGIVESQELWSTHAGLLNDAQEIKYGASLVESVIDDYEAKKTEKELISILRHLRMYVVNFRRGARPKKQQNGTGHQVFVTCFCKNPDLLSQWRGYGERGGYSLGFQFDDATRIQDHADEKWFKPIVRKVIYSRDEQVELVKKYLDVLLEILPPAQPLKPSRGTLLLGASNLLIDMILSFKHKGFKEEKEYRILRSPLRGRVVENVQLRTSSDYVIPYLETNFGVLRGGGDIEPTFPLSEIYMGPTLKSEVAEIGVDYLLRKNGFDPDSLEIESSAIPFRKL